MEEEKKNQNDPLGMEFDAEMAEEIESDWKTDADQDLLQLQKRKSTPKVVIEEFVQGASSDEEEDEPANKEEEPEQKGKKLHKTKTHYEIDDVSILFSLRFYLVWEPRQGSNQVVWSS